MANRKSAKMTPRQKRIVAVLAIANIVVMLALRVAQTYHFGSSPAALPKPTPALSQQTCQWQATQRLAQGGLSGTVALTPQRIGKETDNHRRALRFAIMYSLAPGQTVDEAAQSVWTAFDIALALLEEECAIFSRVEVVIIAHDGMAEAGRLESLPHTTINASVSTADLVAFNSGTLSEDEFIERVTYTAGNR